MKSVFYIITSYECAQGDLWKPGVASAGVEELKDRYKTDFPKIIIYYFQYIDNALEVEGELKRRLYQYRIDNHNGKKSEWYKINYTKLYSVLKSVIDTTDGLVIDRLADIDLSDEDIKGRFGKKNNNNNNKDKNDGFINIIRPVDYDYPHSHFLSLEEELTIFKNPDLPIYTYFKYTHLHPDKPKCHNIGYVDKESDMGYIVENNKAVEKPINYILEEVCNKRFKELKSMYVLCSDLLSDDCKKRINQKFEFFDKILDGKEIKETSEILDHPPKAFMFTYLKKFLYTNRFLFLRANQRSDPKIYKKYDECLRDFYLEKYVEYHKLL